MLPLAADPDKSNPTRSRWERPLDTIRSFEAAIDGAYKRKSMIRSGKLLAEEPPHLTHGTLTHETQRRIRWPTGIGVAATIQVRHGGHSCPTTVQKLTVSQATKHGSVPAVTTAADPNRFSQSNNQPRTGWGSSLMPTPNLTGEGISTSILEGTCRRLPGTSLPGGTHTATTIGTRTPISSTTRITPTRR
jgi:hypothetical protein